MRLLSGDTMTPWGVSIPLISPTTLFVATSMIWMLSPAELVWITRSFDPCAAAREKDTVQRATPARTVRPPRRPPRNVCLFVIFVILLFNDSYPPEPIVRRQFVHQETSLLPAATSLPSRTLSASTNADPASSRIAGLRRDGNRHQPLRRAGESAVCSPGSPALPPA